MAFFNNFPTILIDDKIITDITLRLNYSTLYWLNQPLMYYDYVLKDSDTPDNIADRYYNDPNLHWIVLTTNYILNPLFEFPLRQDAFERYLNQKYKTQAHRQNMTGFEYATSTIAKNGYQKLVTITNIITQEIVSQDYYIVDPWAYQTIKEEFSTFEDENEQYEYRVSKRLPITIYEEEYTINEKKRNIKILKKEHQQEAIFKLTNLLKSKV